ncbi:hypothetical protein JHW43_004898 [Diplocarpon mali]|nr:hypothetical protein JHW43_004898 [Diplocarpon mali]
MEQSETPARDDAGRMEIPTLSIKTLLDLPPELILRIAYFLPTTSTALFSLCCKRLASQLSSSTWNLLSNLESEDRIQFLTILSRDLPRYYACHGCIHLHLSSSDALPADLFAPASSSSCIPASARGGHSEDGVVRISNYSSPYSLRFSHVQLALKRHHHGPEHGISLSDLSHTDIKVMGGSTFLFSVEARIVSDEVVVRSQEWVLTSEHPTQDFGSRSITHNVCQHLLTYNAEFQLNDDLTRLMRCRSSHRPADAGCACMGLQQCASCPMEYQIDFVDLERIGTAFCATKWSNLGPGLTTLDSKWRGHNLSQDEYVLHNLPLGSIRSAYESQEGISLDDFSAENKKRLTSFLPVIGNTIHINPYASNWKFAGRGIWYIDTSVEPETIALLFRQLLLLASTTFAQLAKILLGVYILLWSKIL